MTPQAAARRFLDVVLRYRFTDVLDLVDPGDDDPSQAAARAAYARVEAAIRKSWRYKPSQVDRAETALINAFRSEDRVAVEQAFSLYEDASAQELAVMRQAAYLIGIEVGRSMRRGVAR